MEQLLGQRTVFLLTHLIQSRQAQICQIRKDGCQCIRTLIDYVKCNADRRDASLGMVIARFEITNTNIDSTNGWNEELLVGKRGVFA